jgi:hypothetical protein
VRVRMTSLLVERAVLFGFFLVADLNGHSYTPKRAWGADISGTN